MRMITRRMLLKNNNRSLTRARDSLKKLFMWFTKNEMMANADKRHLFLSSVEDHTIEIDGSTVKNLYCEKLSEMQFDDQLKFDFYIEKLCKNANRKSHALARVTPYMDLSKKQILMNAFFGSQFNNYCPLISMCHSRKRYHISNRLHEKGLHIIYNDKTFYMKNYYLKMALFLCMIRIYKILL